MAAGSSAEPVVLHWDGEGHSVGDTLLLLTVAYLPACLCDLNSHVQSHAVVPFAYFLSKLDRIYFEISSLMNHLVNFYYSLTYTVIIVRVCLERKERGRIGLGIWYALGLHSLTCIFCIENDARTWTWCSFDDGCHKMTYFVVISLQLITVHDYSWINIPGFMLGNLFCFLGIGL